MERVDLALFSNSLLRRISCEVTVASYLHSTNSSLMRSVVTKLLLSAAAAITTRRYGMSYSTELDDKIVSVHRHS